MPHLILFLERVVGRDFVAQLRGVAAGDVLCQRLVLRPPAHVPVVLGAVPVRAEFISRLVNVDKMFGINKRAMALLTFVQYSYQTLINRPRNLNHYILLRNGDEPVL